MRLKWKTWTALGAGCLLLGVLFFFRHSQRPPVPLKVFQVRTNTGFYGAMILLSDGTLCMSDTSNVRAFNRDGQEQWSFSWGTNGVRFTRGDMLARLGDDTVLSVFADGSLRNYGLVALRDGKPLWEKIVGPNLYSISTSQARSNKVILLTAGCALIALDHRGEELWRQTTLMEQYMSPVENVLGELLHYDREGTSWMIVLRSAEDGQELRRIATGQDPMLRPANPEKPGRYFYSSDQVSNAATAFASQSRDREGLAYPGWAFCPPAIAANGTIYLTTRIRDCDPVLLAVHPDGRILWSFGLSWGHAIAAPVIGRDGTIYLVTGDRWVRAINSDGTLKWGHRIPAKLAFRQPPSLKHLTDEFQRRFGLRENQPFGRPVLSPDGRLFVSFHYTGSIYVFDTGDSRGY